MRSLLLVLSALLISTGMAESVPKGDKTTTIYIPSDAPPPASAEKVVPTHPFFSESQGTEIMETIQELETRIEKLEKRVSQLEKKNPVISNQ